MSDDYADDKQSRTVEIQQSVAELFVDELSVHETTAIFMASRIWCAIYLNHGIFFDRKRDIDALEKFERSIRAALTALEDEMSEQAANALIAQSLGNGLGSFLENASSLCADAKQTRKVINDSERTKDKVSRMNEPAIKLVEYSRNIWEAATCTPAPKKSLNPASCFGGFLADLFDKLEVEGNPQSAFRAWAKHIGNRDVDT